MTHHPEDFRPGPDLRRRIMVSPTGARPERAAHPRLPLSEDGIADAARAAFKVKAGAGALHLHVREAAGRLLADNAQSVRDLLRAAMEG